MCMLMSSPSGFDSFESLSWRKRSSRHELCSGPAPSYPCGSSIVSPLHIIHFAVETCSIFWCTRTQKWCNNSRKIHSAHFITAGKTVSDLQPYSVRCRTETPDTTVSGVRNYLSFYSGVFQGWRKGCGHLGQQRQRGDKINILSRGWRDYFLCLTNFKLLRQIKGISISVIFFLNLSFLWGMAIVIACPPPHIKNLAMPLTVLQ